MNSHARPPRLANEDIVASVISEARKHDLQAEQISVSHVGGSEQKHQATWVYKKTVRIGTALCRVLTTQSNNMRSNKSGVYPNSRIWITRDVLQRYSFCIFCSAVPGHETRFFIVPSSVLFESYFKDTTRTSFCLTVPWENKERHGKKAQVRIWEFEGSWELLRKTE